MVLEASLLNTQYYHVCIKGNVEQSSERSSALYQHYGVVAIEKGAFRSPSTTVANVNLYIYIYIYIYLFIYRIKEKPLKITHIFVIMFIIFLKC